MTDATSLIARRFLDIGGRVMIHPDGHPTAAIDAAAILALNISEQERRRIKRICRAIGASIQVRSTEILRLIREHGTSLPNGWTVWEGC